MMAGRFFLDTEYTNGNYYRGDIIEIALFSESTHRTFRQYVKIPYALPKRVKKVCNINDEVLRQKGVDFTYMIKRLCKFVKSETATPTLIAHNGYLCDFPLLFANCMKYNLEVEDIFKNYTFVDTIKVLQRMGCRKTGLKTISSVKYQQHNAASDAKALASTFTKQEVYTNLLNQNREICSTGDILQFLGRKLSIPIDKLCILSSSVNNVEQLTYFLKEYTHKKTALSNEQIGKVSTYAFKYLR